MLCQYMFIKSKYVARRGRKGETEKILRFAQDDTIVSVILSDAKDLLH